MNYILLKSKILSFGFYLIIFLLPNFSLIAQADIYIHNDKKGITTQITNLPGFSDYNPQFSNDGKYIIFDRFEVANPGNTGLFAGSIASGIFTLIPGGEGGNDATWDPSGKMIAFDKVPYGLSNIYTLPISGGTPVLLAPDGIDPDWSPNGKHIVYVDITTGMLNTVHTISGIITSLGVYGKEPDWSNNGQYIAYADNDNIFKLRISGSGSASGIPVQLTSDPLRFNNHPTWSINNRDVIYASVDVGFTNSDIYIVDASGGIGSLYAGVPSSQDYDPDEGKSGYTVYSGTDGGVAARSRKDITVRNIPVTITPNVISDKTLLEFVLEENTHVFIGVYDVSGRLVENVLNASLDKGIQSIEWNPGSEIAEGIYFINLRAELVNGTLRIIKK